MNNSTGGVKNRRKSALNRLEKQLVKGTKIEKVIRGGMHKSSPTFKMGKIIEQIIPLTEPDVKRIKKEIETLKTKI